MAFTLQPEIIANSIPKTFFDATAMKTSQNKIPKQFSMQFSESPETYFYVSAM